ncbi:MAG: PTS sugar transporter subunit IIA [Bacteroidetes bacterium]|nr:PTS sugar transporter subunit IIA [Bacteroidota bacterium]
MKLKNLLSHSVISTDLQGTNKEEIIGELLDILMKTGKVSDRNLAVADLMDRESKMSTGMQFGVAIPHAKTKAVKELFACIGVHKTGIDFDAFDNELSRIFIMTLSPVDRTGPHVQFLAEISMVLKSKDARLRLLQAETSKEALAVFGL